MNGRESVFLVGFMLAGKSTVGGLLAAALGWPLVDLDAEVEKRIGRPIREIWERSGERPFRELERATLLAEAGRRAVVATGGGIVVDGRNRAVMRRSGLVLWLQVPLAVLCSRAKGVPSGVRPLWQDELSLRKLYREREGQYAFADGVVAAVAGEPPEVTAAEALRLVRAWEGTR